MDVDKKIYGMRAVELLNELNKSNLFLPKFESETVGYISKESSALFKNIAKTIEKMKKRQLQDNSEEQLLEPKLKSGLILHHQSLKRNKECVLAYLMERLRRIQRVRWEIGSNIPPEVSQNMNIGEKNFFEGYNKLLTDYMSSLNDLDLTANLKHPPKDLSIEVEVLEDKGEVVTKSGRVVNLQKRTRLNMLRSDAEPFINEGIVEHIR